MNAYGEWKYKLAFEWSWVVSFRPCHPIQEKGSHVVWMLGREEQLLLSGTDLRLVGHSTDWAAGDLL